MMTVADSGRMVALPGPYGRVLRTLDCQKQKTLDTVEGYSPEWLTYSPASDAWSILQPLDHRIRTERAVRETAARNLAHSMPRPSALQTIASSGWFRAHPWATELHGGSRIPRWLAAIELGH